MRDLLWPCLVFVTACGNDCVAYKKLACENPNSVLCHEAMKETSGLSAMQCKEKIEMIKAVRTMQKLEEEPGGTPAGSKK